MAEYTDTISRSRTQAIAYVALSVAIIAICSWVSIPIGPIPFTLQMFGIPLIIALLPASWSIGAVWSFVLLGAIGVPVFSGFKGGIGALLGPTGGFIVGYLIGVILAALLLKLVRRRVESKAAIVACEVIAGLVFTVCAYAVGWVQFSVVAGVSLAQSFAASVAPFILPDIAKVVLAVLCAQAVKRAVRIPQA